MLSAETLTPLFLFLAELLSAVREALTKRRQDQATALQPSADATEAHIRELVAEALTRAGSKPSVAQAPGPVAPAPGSLAPHADVLKDHIDAIVAEALERSQRPAPGTDGAQHPGLPPAAEPPAAGTVPPVPAAGDLVPDSPLKHGPAGS